MAILKWSGTMKYAGYSGIAEGDDRKMWWYDSIIGDPLPALNEWSAPRLTQYLGERGKKKRKPAKIGDAPNAGMVGLISQRASEALQDILQRDALLYPVVLDDAKEAFYMVVAKHEIDCLDRDKSIGKKQKYGPTPDLFASIEEWTFDESALGDHDLFRLPDSSTTIYVTERFKQRVIDAGLKGFCLKRTFWEENPFIS